MEFLDINLTKASSLLIHAIHSPFYWRISKKTILFPGFKNPYKKSTKQEKLSLFTKNAVQEFHLWLKSCLKIGCFHSCLGAYTYINHYFVFFVEKQFQVQDSAFSGSPPPHCQKNLVRKKPEIFNIKFYSA